MFAQAFQVQSRAVHGQVFCSTLECLAFLPGQGIGGSPETLFQVHCPRERELEPLARSCRAHDLVETLRGNRGMCVFHAPLYLQNTVMQFVLLLRYLYRENQTDGLFERSLLYQVTVR